MLLRGMRASPTRLAALLSALEPEAGIDGLQAFLGRRSTGGGLSERSARGLYRQVRARATRLRPIAPMSQACIRWSCGWSDSCVIIPGRPWQKQRSPVTTNGRRSMAGCARAGKGMHGCAHRQHAGTGCLGEIQRAWQKLGYPFEALTPSYATAIGASGDRPSALAELMGIVVNCGMRLPAARVESLEFARDTPFETRLGYRPAQTGKNAAPGSCRDRSPCPH